jgi:hypothetical protein
MLKMSGLANLINDEDELRWLNPSIRAGQNSDSKAREYFSQLSKSQGSISRNSTYFGQKFSHKFLSC